MDKRKKGAGSIIAAIFLFMIVAIPTGQAPVAFPEPGLAWHNPTIDDVTDVTVGDLTGNGVADVAYVEILVPTTLSAVYGINGTDYWTKSSVSGYSIAVGDIDGDVKNEVIAGGWNNGEGKSGITIFEDDGTFKFFYETNSPFVKDMELGDVDNNSVADIVACNNVGEGWIYAFNGTDKSNLTGWPQNFTDESIEDIALGNLDENPGLDIAAISNSVPATLYVFNSTGYLMWSNNTVYGRTVEIGDVDGDTDKEVVIGDLTLSHVYVYDGATGALESAFNTNNPPTEVELGDLDGDTNDLEIAVITGKPPDASLFALAVNSGQLNELWNFSIEWEPIYYGEGLAIGDVDGDGGNEVVALSDTDDYGGGYKVWAFDGLDGNGDGQGDVVWMYALPSYPNDVEVGDVDDDGDMEVIVGTKHENEGSVYALFTKQPALEVNKTVWDPVNETWVKERTAKINDTLRFNCTITNTGNVNLTQIRFWDILDCSLEYAGDATMTIPGDEIPINLNETPYHQQPYNYTFKQRILHPNTTYNDSCVLMPGYLWDPYEPLGGCPGKPDYLPTFDELCPENKLHELHDWVDTNNDSRVSACDQLWLESYEEWYHVDHVPYTLLVNDTETDGSMYLDSVLDYEALNLSEPNGTAWAEVCWIELCCSKDRYNLSVWYDTNNTEDLNVNDTLVLQNTRTGEVAQYTVEEVAVDLVVSMEWEVDHLVNNSMISVPLGQRLPVGALALEDGQNSFIVTGPIEPLNLFVLEPNQTITIEYNATVVKCGVDKNTFRAKGNYSGIWYYSNPDVVTITVPCVPPSGEATDDGGISKEVYTHGEPVYAVGSGFEANKNVSIYIVPFQQLNDGVAINTLGIIVGPVNVTTDGNGNISPELVWPNPIPGHYLMIFDDPNGKYDPGTDPIDEFSVTGAAVPLITPLGLAALIGLLSFVALSTLMRRKRR